MLALVGVLVGRPLDILDTGPCAYDFLHNNFVFS